MKAELFGSEIYQERLKEQKPITRKLWLEGLTYQCFFEQNRYSWEEVRDQLKELREMDGYRWRLPTLKELEKLLTKASQKNLKGDRHYINKFFLDFMPLESIFWSASIENIHGVWAVDFSKGYYCLRDKSSKYYLLLVCDSRLELKH